MNKKIVSFVLAMVLSVSLGFGSLSYALENSIGSGDTNSGVLTANAGESTFSSEIIKRITQVFHYQSGLIKDVTGADGSKTWYDRGQFRMTTKYENGIESISSISFYGATDVEDINRSVDDSKLIEGVGGLEAFMRIWGVTDTQFQGGGSQEQWTSITKDEYDKAYGTDAAGDFKAVEENGEMKYSKKVSSSKKAEKVKWLSSAEKWLAGGINRSITINFEATDGASVTFNANGKAYETYAWDNELITKNEYISENGINGVVTEQAELDLVVKNGAEDKVVSTSDKKYYELSDSQKKEYKKAWSRTKTLGGKVVSCVQINSTTGQYGSELRSYRYNEDGQLKQLRDFVNGTITIYNPTATITLSPLDKGMTLDAMSEDKIDDLVKDAVTAAGTNGNVSRSTGFYISAVQVLNPDGTIDYTISRDDSGKTTTTSYIRNVAVATGNGVLASGYLRDAANEEYSYVLNGGTKPQKKADVISVHWSNGKLAQVFDGITKVDKKTNNKGKEEIVDATSDNGILERFVTSMGWDNTPKRRAFAINTITDALNFNAGAQTIGLEVSYRNTTYSQDEIDSLYEKNKDKMDNKSVPAIVSDRFVASITVYHHNARSHIINTADFDTSLSRAAFISATSTFTNSALEGYNLSATSSYDEFENAFNDIASKIENEYKNNKLKASDFEAFDEKNQEKIPVIDEKTGEPKKDKEGNVITEKKPVSRSKKSSGTIYNIAKKYFKDTNKMEMMISWTHDTDKDKDTKIEKKDREYVDGMDVGNWRRENEYDVVEKVYNKDYSNLNPKNASDRNPGPLQKYLKKVREYVLKLDGLIRGGSIGSLQEHLDSPIREDNVINCSYSIATTTTHHYTLAKDPMMNGVPTMTEDRNTLIYGPGCTVNLNDGKGERVLQKGEEVQVDISMLSDKEKDEIFNAINSGKKVMTMGDIDSVDQKNRSMKVTANRNYGNAFTTDPKLMETYTKASQNGGGNIKWLTDNMAVSQDAMKKTFGERWKEIKYDLFEGAAAIAGRNNF